MQALSGLHLDSSVEPALRCLGLRGQLYQGPSGGNEAEVRRRGYPRFVGESASQSSDLVPPAPLDAAEASGAGGTDFRTTPRCERPLPEEFCARPHLGLWGPGTHILRVDRHVANSGAISADLGRAWPVAKSRASSTNCGRIRPDVERSRPILGELSRVWNVLDPTSASAAASAATSMSWKFAKSGVFSALVRQTSPVPADVIRRASANCLIRNYSRGQRLKI